MYVKKSFSILVEVIISFLIISTHVFLGLPLFLKSFVVTIQSRKPMPRHNFCYRKMPTIKKASINQKHPSCTLVQAKGTKLTALHILNAQSALKGQNCTIQQFTQRELHHTSSSSFQFYFLSNYKEGQQPISRTQI